ncbi:MAG: hypothetical protein ABSF35_08345 [Polyangia bacterium]
MSDAQLGRRNGETNVGGPDLVTLQDRGGEKVRIDPPETSARKAARTHKSDDFMMGNCVRLLHLRVGREKFATTSDVTNEKFAEADAQTARVFIPD